MNTITITWYDGRRGEDHLRLSEGLCVISFSLLMQTHARLSSHTLLSFYVLISRKRLNFEVVSDRCERLWHIHVIPLRTDAPLCSFSATLAWGRCCFGSYSPSWVFTVHRDLFKTLGSHFLPAKGILWYVSSVKWLRINVNNWPGKRLNRPSKTKTLDVGLTQISLSANQRRGIKRTCADRILSCVSQLC